ncbi:MAG: TatD family hydrolase [Clostridia bacterium]|nr:TatD family hydrolase [Clostridia bacterium]
MNTKLFDSHAHYFDKRFDNEHEGGADDILNDILHGTSCVGRIINVGTNMDNAMSAIAQAVKYPEVYAAIGIHPEDCLSLENMDSEIKRLLHLLKSRKENKIVAIGEIGLDYHYLSGENVVGSKEKQMQYFVAQLDIADSMGLPVIIHDREAHGDCFDTVRKYDGLRGVFHSYSGSAEMASQLCRYGWYISFSGTVTFKNAQKVKEAVAVVPSDRILIETDAPYLAPHPFRGKLNNSALMINTASVIADILNTNVENIIDMTYNNACKLFEIN